MDNIEINKKNARAIAFNNIKSALKFDIFLPDRPFNSSWDKFHFFPSDHMFCAEFSKILLQLLAIENANLCCLLNITKTRIFEYEAIEAIFLDDSITGLDYDTLLRGNGPSNGWIYVMDSYACASDVGDWCIYCDRENEIAVIGFRNTFGSLKFNLPLIELCAKPIDWLLAEKEKAIFPFNKLVPDWRKNLSKNFGIK